MILDSSPTPFARTPIVELVDRALAHSSALLGGERWARAEGTALRPVAAVDDDAWIALGVALEALTIGAESVGLGIDDIAVDESEVRIEISSRRTVPASSARLAVWLGRAARMFGGPSGRIAAHMPARLAAAAALHGATLPWTSSTAFDDLAALMCPVDDVPVGASAIATVQVASDDSAAFVQGGRAVGRVALEATSLNLIVAPVLPVSRRVWNGLPEASSTMRAYRALVPHDTAYDVLAFWVGA